MFRTLSLLCVTLYGAAAIANNGQVAMGFPVTEIIVDGDVRDWPAGTPTYPLRRNHFGDCPLSDADMRAWFMVGYDRDLDRLFVAVHVKDDSHVLSSSGKTEYWKSLDGAGVHIAFAHGPNGQPVHDAKAVQGMYMPVGQHLETDVKRTETSHTYEWSFDFRPYREGAARSNPFTIPFCVYATDKDEDGSISQRFWSPNAWKTSNANRAGDLVVNFDPTQLGRVRGQVSDDISTSVPDGMANSYGATLVKYVSTSNKQLVVEVMSDTQGSFEIQLPAGEYERSVQDWKNKEASKQTIVLQANAHTVDLIKTPKAWSDRAVQVASNANTSISKRRKSSGTTHSGRQSRMLKTLGSGSIASIRLPTALRLQDYRTNGATFAVSRYSTSNGLPNGFSRDVVVDVRGYTWVSNGLGLLRLSNTDTVTYRKRDGLPSDAVCCLHMHGSDLWVGTASGVAVVDTETLRLRLLPETAGKHVFGIHALHDGRVGVCSGRGLIAFNPDDFSVRHYGRPEGIEEIRVLSCCPDPSGQFTWVGTDDGLSHFDGTRFSRNLTMQDGLPDCRVWKIFRDAQDGLWFGGNRSLFYYDDDCFRTVHTSEQESYQCCDGITQDANGLVWAATWLNRGLQMQRGLIAFASPSPNGIVHELPIDALRVHGGRFGNLWVTGSGFVSRLDMRQARIKLGEVTAVAVATAKPGNDQGEATSTEAISDGPNVWFAATANLDWHLYRTNERLEAWDDYRLTGRVTALLPHAQRGEAVWVGTRTSGLKLFAEGKFSYPSDESPYAAHEWPRRTSVLDLLTIREDSPNWQIQSG